MDGVSYVKMATLRGKGDGRIRCDGGGGEGTVVDSVWEWQSQEGEINVLFVSKREVRCIVCRHAINDKLQG